MNGPYIVVDRDSKAFYRRGIGGSLHWTYVLADATKFVVFESATQLCARFWEQDIYCFVRALTFNEPELNLFG